MKEFDNSEAPSEGIDRQEHKILMGESMDSNRHRFYPIIHVGNGKPGYIPETP